MFGGVGCTEEELHVSVGWRMCGSPGAPTGARWFQNLTVEWDGVWIMH